MTNLLRANFYRLRKTLIVWGGMAVSAGFGAFMVYTRVSDYNRYGEVFQLDQIFFIYALVVGFLLSVVVSTTLGTEYHDGTIRNKLSVGGTRREIYLANLLSLTLTGWVYCGAYILAVTVCGVPFAGWLTVDGKAAALALVGTLLLEAAFAALYCCISMNCSYKATSAILCIMLFFGLMMASTYVNARLEAPAEHQAYTLTVDGELQDFMEPNPRYLQPNQRAVYEFVYDLLPTGQATQYFTLGFAHPVRMMVCAVSIFAVSTLGGLAIFRRKDLK